MVYVAVLFLAVLGSVVLCYYQYLSKKNMSHKTSSVLVGVSTAPAAHLSNAITCLLVNYTVLVSSCSWTRTEHNVWIATPFGVFLRWQLRSRFGKTDVAVTRWEPRRLDLNIEPRRATESSLQQWLYVTRHVYPSNEHYTLHSNNLRFWCVQTVHPRSEALATWNRK